MDSHERRFHHGRFENGEHYHHGKDVAKSCGHNEISPKPTKLIGIILK